MRVDTEDSGACCGPACHVIPCLCLCCAHADAKVTSVFVQSDFANLKHLKDKLEQANAELDKTHAKRITRYIR